MTKGIFYDPGRRRWKRLRRVFDITGLVISIIILGFIVLIFRNTSLPEVLLPAAKRTSHAIADKHKTEKHPRGKHRKTSKQPSQVVLNADEGLRAAFYVSWDAGSFSSLREYSHEIDLLYPEWLHVLTPDGHLQAVNETNVPYDVIGTDGRARPVDAKVMELLKAQNAETEVFPLVNNFDPVRRVWMEDALVRMFGDAAARAKFRQEILTFLASDKYHGLTLDFEDFPYEAQPGFQQLVKELSDNLHQRGLKLYIAVPPENVDFDFAYLSQHADGLILMNYDQHVPSKSAGPIAAQDWFAHNLDIALKTTPREKLICAIGNYGYEWALDKRGKVIAADSRSVQEAWLAARDSEANVEMDDASLNPRFAYRDEVGDRHDIWFLDAATAVNQMRAARERGISTFALWRLGSEDRSLWNIWEQPNAKDVADKLKIVPPGYDVDMEGSGEVVHIESEPQSGTRVVTLDDSTGLITQQTFDQYPNPYRIYQYGYSPKTVALTFDDGPDPNFTPKILDVLKDEHAPAAFFLIGDQAQKYSSITRRVFREGHEIGNHTFNHPDISNISRRLFEVELNTTERFFEAELGIKPLMFRPPYSIDQEPDTADEVRPLEISQKLGYITVGDKIDPNDWQENPRPTAQQIVNSVLEQLKANAASPSGPGNVILLHDGGGERTETVKALPILIRQLRVAGYEIVPVSKLIGQSRASIMAPISPNERWSAKVAMLGFWIYGSVREFIYWIFIVGDILMTARLISIGLMAAYDRLRKRPAPVGIATYRPAVAVLIPAYNEEKVIERTIRSVLLSDYPKLRAIVIDDGSKDNTLHVARSLFAQEIAAGRLTVLTKPNGGKAAALNFGLQHVTEEIFVGIDADTLIAHDAISALVPHFADSRVGAIAGNAKVGNRVNLWTRWQALEYITSQNFERRAFNTLNVVTVVPGAIGAWRTDAVRAVGGYQPDTVAEDADLTMALLQQGYRVNFEDQALAFTEAPTTAKMLMRQRFRWSFGILQSIWKHRLAFARGGSLGGFALPNIFIFQILLPLVSPFIDIMFAAGAINYGLNKYFHPETANPRDFEKLVVFFAIFLIVDFVTSAFAFALERRRPGSEKEFLLLGHVWLQRFAYRQVFSIVLFKTLKRAFEGGTFSWDKLERTATVRDPELVGKA